MLIAALGSQRVDRSFQTDAQAGPARPETATASGASAVRRVRRQHHANRGAAVLASLDVEPAAQRPRTLLDVLEARPPPLARAVVGDHGLHGPVVASGDADRDPRRGPAPDRLV